MEETHLAVSAKDRERKVQVFNRDATVDGVYLRILVRDNEHMGQLIAYARMTGVVPPWPVEMKNRLEARELQTGQLKISTVTARR